MVVLLGKNFSGPIIHQGWSYFCLWNWWIVLGLPFKGNLWSLSIVSDLCKTWVTLEVKVLSGTLISVPTVKGYFEKPKTDYALRLECEPQEVPGR